MTDRMHALELLRRALGDPAADFRPGQWEAIDSLANRRQNLLVVQRTGWGKSVVYFIATRILRDQGKGPTLIVSPLLALMRNQIEAAERLGIMALTINSTNEHEWPSLIHSIQNSNADALLISPERLANDSFVETVLHPLANRIGLLVVDEAHCISDWGHDFRPDYRRLVNVLRLMPPNLPILGTTATANNRVIEDVKSQLGDVQVQRGSLMRESLALQTIRLPDQSARLAWLAEHLPELPGTGIVYTLTKRDAYQVADWLRRHSIEARDYYSGVLPDSANDQVFLRSQQYAKFENLREASPTKFKGESALSDFYREYLEDLLMTNRVKALVATTALGMGYDKPDLGFVVHYQAPGSVVAYYQQVGRAGRAINHAVGVLMSGREDVDIQEYFRETAFPDENHVNAILDALAQSDGLTERQLEETVNLRKGQIEKVLKMLSVDNPAPVLKDGSKWVRTPTHYRMNRERIQHLTRQRAEEWQEVQDYIDSRDCLMVFLAQALNEEDPKPCGKCALCLGKPVVAESFGHQLAVDAALYLKHSEMALECNKQVAGGAFPQYGFRGNLPTILRAETGRILSHWGDAGWGKLVADGKHAGRFGDEMVEAVVEMIKERWKPNPPPAWVTCVPSRSHPELVPDFSRRLAQRLGLPFLPVVEKIRDNQPQKAQENRFHQCHNLDGVFKIAAKIPQGPLLLVDDIIDSAWTMTVVTALLRQAGSGPVFPVALATTKAGD